jgi:hypothetical protein
MQEINKRSKESDLDPKDLIISDDKAEEDRQHASLAKEGLIPPKFVSRFVHPVRFA